jgi:hypothetical protein
MIDREFLGWACLAGGAGGLVAILGMATLDLAEWLAGRHADRRRGGVPADPVPCPSCLPDAGQAARDGTPG